MELVSTLNIVTLSLVLVLALAELRSVRRRA